MSSNKYWKKGKKVRKQQLNVSVLKREYCAVGNYTQINRRCKMDLYVTLCKAEWYYRIILSSEVSMGLWEWLGYSLVRKHLTRGFQCAVLDLSGTLWPLLIPEYSGIKRRGTPFRGLRNPGISYYGDKYPLPFYEPDAKRWLFAVLSLIGIAEAPLSSLSCPGFSDPLKGALRLHPLERAPGAYMQQHKP